MQIKDVMTPNPVCCLVTDRLEQAAQMMTDFDCGAIPVVDNHETRRVVGIITDRDITTRTIGRGKEGLHMTVGECMSTPVVTVWLDDKLDTAIEKMQTNQVRRVPVVDALNRCCGIIAQADIALNTPKGTTAEVVQKVSEPNPVSSPTG